MIEGGVGLGWEEEIRRVGGVRTLGQWMGQCR